MLKLADDSDLKMISDFCFCNAFGTYILCRAKAYGFGRGFSRIWFSKESGSVDTVVSSFDNNAVIQASDKTDFEELSFFVTAMGFASVLTDCETAKKCNISDFSEKKMFALTQKSFRSAEQECTSEPDLKEVYLLLCECFPRVYLNDKNSYLSWLSDYMFRRRRGYSHIKAVVKNKEPLSVALTSAEAEDSVVIGSVACKKNARRNGFGKSAVLALADNAIAAGKTVFTVSENDESSRFYEKIGFTEIGKAAYIERF